MDVIVVRGRGKAEVGDDFIAINTTSQSKEEWSKEVSPFFLGPIPMWGNLEAKNLENAWQYSKVYVDQVDENNNPTKEWFAWMKAGIALEKAVRYPRGRGAVPLYSYWDGRKLSYIEARHQIYAPLYAKAVEKTVAYGKIKSLFDKNNGRLCLWDFDGYDHKRIGLSLEEVFYNTHKKMGHGFVLAMMLRNNRIWETPFDKQKINSSEGRKK